MNNLISNRAASIIYALTMAVFGVNHFMKAGAMGGMVPSYMPGDGTIWVYITGAALVAAALAIIINKYAKLAAGMLAVMLIIFVFTLHLPAAMSDNEMEKTTGLISLLKDTGLAMAAIMIANNAKH